MTMLRNGVCLLAGCILNAVMTAGSAGAQEMPKDARVEQTRTAPDITETIYLKNATGQNDLNDVQTALRNSFTRVHIYGVAGQYAMTVRGTADEVQAMKKVVSDLDRPRKVYRVTYTVHESDGGKPTGTQHYALLVNAGGRTMLKQGNRVPLVTGMSTGENPAQSSQVQYIDVGLNIEASVEGVGLRTKVELSGITDDKSGIGAQDPVVRQTMVEGVLNVDAHKPITLGSIDIPGSTRHEDIEVAAEQVSQ